MPGQLTFDLPARIALGREDFFVAAPNALALAALDRDDWPQRKMLLIGPEGAGKSHLARVWAADSGAAIVAADALAGGPGGLPATAQMAPATLALVVEDADRIAGDRAAETALFHLHNHHLAEGGRLLLTARAPAGAWGLVLPDLLSRLEATELARLLPPDDRLLAAVLVKLFADRQLLVAPDLIDWLLRHMERSFAAAHATVARLDAAALSARRPLTLRFARTVLDSGAPEPP
ncbi:MAG: chromosomal replication initiator DnaA [Defluviimonas sp.]|uniref:HdaA/DnaA family protein n=1 Tax=Albidovulum sp. TaxID=1872424 RepID=UPI001E0D612C|nr:chromosomal replication initiator DnaA [Paracoccaceae bacterium]MCC0063680.1 chromosomal replication initiator DnaA [Defluviimonas sp.]